MTKTELLDLMERTSNLQSGITLQSDLDPTIVDEMYTALETFKAHLRAVYQNSLTRLGGAQ